MRKVYFDYASTAPTDPEVIKAMEPYFFEKFGNPASPHSFGQEAHKALEDSRESVAHFLGVRSSEIIFNSGASEGNNHAILGIARGLKARGNHMITTAIEHPSVLYPIQYLEKEGFNITYLPVDSDGLVNPEDVKKAITDKTILISVMHANNVIGTIQPISEIGTIANTHKIPFLVDAVQTAGHVALKIEDIKCDLLTLSAHKFCGPKGCGVIYIRKGTPLKSYLLGGEQERGHRASTQNVSGAVGLAKAIELCREKRKPEETLHTKMRDRLLAEVPKLIDGTKVNGHRTKRLPQNTHFSFEGVKGDSLLPSLDMAGIAASRGSTCTAGSMKVSYVLKAIGLSDEMASASLRISLGRWTTEADIEFLLERLPKVIKNLRK